MVRTGRRSIPAEVIAALLATACSSSLTGSSSAAQASAGPGNAAASAATTAKGSASAGVSGATQSGGVTQSAAGSGAVGTGAASAGTVTGGTLTGGAVTGGTVTGATVTGGTGSSGSGGAQVIYQNGAFAPGWESMNWASGQPTCPGSSNAAPIAGQTALEIDLSCGQYDGNFVVNWTNPTSMSAFPVLDFDLYLTDATQLGHLQFNVQTGSNSSASAMPLSGFVTSATAGVFTHVTIPLSSLTSQPSYLGFIFSFDQATGTPFYLNDVRVSPGTATSAGASTTTTIGNTSTMGTTGTPGAVTTGTSGSGATAGTTGSGASVAFTIDASKGPARQFQPPTGPTPISPYVYGVNQFAAWNTTTRWGSLRWGGDSFSAWNWTNGQGNSGSDYCFWQGNEGGGSGLAAVLSPSQPPSLSSDQASGIASLVTVPILGWVASSAVTNNVWSGSNPPCPGSPSCSSGSANGYAANVGNLDFASTDPSSKAFVTNHPTKGSTFCTCTSSTNCSTCVVDSAGPVYEDELVNYIRSTFGDGGAPIFFSLDNEPNYWPGTHPELWPNYTGTPGCGTDATVTYEDIVNQDATYAAAVKSAWPSAKVFGPVVAQDGVIYARDYSSPHLPTPFAQFYLEQMAANSDSAGHPLIDVFDTHYYTTGSTSAQCLEIPRMFWDPAFTQLSASQTDQIDFGYSNSLFDSSWYPRQMIPRLEGMISSAYQGHTQAAPGLSFSEYNAGCETTIEGGVAEADLLGIFGREGMYSATAWPLKAITTNGQLSNYLVAAYDLFRNYDGKGSTVGDQAVLATTSDVSGSSVYAFAHSSDATKMELVAINKASSPTPATLSLSHSASFTTVAVYRLVAGSSVGVAAANSNPTIACSGGTCSINWTMPATSASTLVLR